MRKVMIVHDHIKIILIIFIFWSANIFITTNAQEYISLVSRLVFLLSSGFIILVYAVLFKSQKRLTPFEEDRLTQRERTGLIMYGLAVAMELVFYRSWGTIITENPDTVTRLKYVIISFPIAVTVSMALFSPLGNKIARGRFGRKEDIITLLLSSMAFGLIMNALHGKAELKLFAIMTAIGAFAGIGHLFTGKNYLTLTTVLLVIYANTLSVGAFTGVPWLHGTVGFIFFSASLIYLWLRRNRRKDLAPVSC